MGYTHFTFLRRALCSSYKIKHCLLKLIVPASFIVTCVFLFLMIQNFDDDQSLPISILKPPEERLLDNIIKSGVTITNPEMFKRMIRGDYSNLSAILTNTKSILENNSVKSGNEMLKGFINKLQDNITFMSENLSEYVGEKNPLTAVHWTHFPNSTSKNTITKQKSQSAFIVILVISRPCNVLLRLAARKTWAMDAELYKIQVRFVVGRQENWSDIVDRESSMHNDVIIFEDEDIEEVLPSKVIRGFEWAVYSNPLPIYIMKIDDDTIINLPFLAKEIYRPTTVGATQIVGSVRENVKVIRDFQKDKWAVTMLDYPSLTYPTYIFGAAYIMRTQTAKTLLEYRYHTYSWVHLEDVYLTGFVAAKAGVRHKQHRGFSSWDEGKSTACEFVLDRRINSINNTEQDFYELYKEIQFLLRSKNKNYCN